MSVAGQELRAVLQVERELVLRCEVDQLAAMQPEKLDALQRYQAMVQSLDLIDPASLTRAEIEALRDEAAEIYTVSKETLRLLAHLVARLRGEPGGMTS